MTGFHTTACHDAAAVLAWLDPDWLYGRHERKQGKVLQYSSVEPFTAYGDPAPVALARSRPSYPWHELHLGTAQSMSVHVLGVMDLESAQVRA